MQCKSRGRARKTPAVADVARCYTGALRTTVDPVPPSLPSFPEVDDACRSLALGTGAAELHGALCGLIAGGGEASGPGWLGKVLVDPGMADPPAGSVLDRLREATVAELEDRDFGFALLLPGEGRGLAERSGALFDWCRGFLGAFGVAAGQDPPLSEEGREALADLARLAAASPQDEGDEEDEEALAEIEEFVRVATLLLHGDCALGPRHRRRLN